MNFIKLFILNTKIALKIIFKLNRFIDEIKINQGTILSTLNESKTSKDIKDYEFKVFSQWGEDGIIQYLVKTVAIRHRTFIEFGIEDFSESNCRFLLQKDDWRGFVIDGNKANILRLQNSYYYWKHNITAIDAFITRENINFILDKSGFEEDLGILSVDLDGNDYYIIESIDKFKPRILIVEYNAVFGSSRKISIPYSASFQRTNAHYSNLYWGASLPAMSFLAKKKGYSLIGTNSAGNNAFFVRNDLLNDKLIALSLEFGYTLSNFRESRDIYGKLTLTNGERRYETIKGMPIFNVETNLLEFL